MSMGSLVPKLISLIVLAVACPALAQVNTGELRLRVTDTAGLGLKASVTVSSTANQYRNTFTASNAGEADVKTLTYGIYLIHVENQGFAPVTETVDVRSAIPVEQSIKLAVAAVTTSVDISSAPLIDPYLPSSIMQIGSEQIQDRVGSLPGRSVQDLVNSQPGWLYEGNAVLHPRGSEYQTQFVIDGIPLTDNRSPGFGPEIGADNLESMSLYTAGFPAEYGRKMGGVVELNTRRETGSGLHGQVILSGGSYDTGSAYAQLQDIWGKNTFGASALGSMSAHYLNPVVPENYTNRGTTGDFSVNYARDLTDSDRLSLSVRHELSRFEIPNELVQQQAGQLQTGDNLETMGTVNYQHIFSPDSMGTLAGMVRDNANNLDSNEDSTPIIATQHNYFREGYFKGTFSLHRGRQEFKAGVESDNTFLHENFSYQITDPSQFDPRHSLKPELHRKPPRPGAVRFRRGPDPTRQLDCQRRPALGPLSTPPQPERLQPPALRRPLSAIAQHGAACLLRSHLSDSCFREHPYLQLPSDRFAERPISPAARAAIPRQLLRRRPHQGHQKPDEYLRQSLPPGRDKLRRRRSTPEHRRQLSNRLR